MGNQSTSGIVEETKATNEAPEKCKEVSSPDELKEENHTQIQERETKDFQEKAAEADSQDAEADKSEEEEHKGSVNEDCETQTDVGSNESNLEEGGSNLNNEVQDQLCTLEGEMQNPVPKCTTITNLNCTPHEAVDTTSELQEDQNMLVKEIVETQGLVDSRATLDLDDHDEETNEDDMVEADTASVEVVSLETSADKEGLGRKDDRPKHEQSNSSDTLNDLRSISLLDLSVAENEKQNECLALVEEKLMMNELGNDDTDNTGYVDQTQSPDQEIKQFLISCSDAPTEMINTDIKDNGDVQAVEIDSFSGVKRVDFFHEVKTIDERDEIGSSNSLKSIPSEELEDPNELKEIEPIPMEGSIAVTDNKEDEELADESILEKAGLREDELSAIENDHEKRETTSILEDSESKARESVEKLAFESNSRYVGVQVELRKSPSFDFGLSFDARCEESDQTPLLYQERTSMRSFSSCSNQRFQNRSVQTEYIGKYESVEVEEKTIRMETSNSESSMAPPLNLLNKEGKADVITEAKQENSASDKKQEIGLKASPSRDDGATISPRGNGKRKPRSSLFTNCICCTAAIS